MNVGLIDVDGRNFPNLALMKISAWHKQNGDSVEWWDGFQHYDRVYMSKIFTFTPDMEFCINADEVIRGGTGYRLYAENLPEEIEHTIPDYSIYPQCDYAVGFLTRGCIRNCPWCVVPKKEGKIRANATWREIKRPDSKRILFIDNNVLASPHGIEQIEQLGREDVWIDFNQALDARLITPEVAKLLAKCHWIRFCRMSCDTSAMLPVIKQAVEYLKEAGMSPSRFWCYALVQDVEEAHKRVLALDDMGVDVFAQPYRDFDGGEPSQLQKDFAHWVNRKELFKSCKFEDFKPRKEKRQ